MDDYEHNDGHDHHDHGHGGHHHHHDHDHQDIPADIALRVKALESVLVEKGMVDPAELDEIVDRFENRVGPAKRGAGGGARVGRSRVPRAPAGRR